MVELVSVIVPSYNAEDTIEKTVRSILEQSHQNLEVFVIDDASKDRTPIILDKFADSRLVVVKKSNNEGVSCARNSGLRMCNGDYIAFCDADDIWKPKKIEKQLEVLRLTNEKMCHTWVERGLIFGCNDNKVFKSLPRVSVPDMLVRNWLTTSSVLLEASIISSACFPDVKHEDYAFWLSLMSEQGVESVCYPEPLTFYYKNPKGLSSNKLKSLIWHFRVQWNFGISPYSIAYHFLRNIFSRLI